MAATNASANVTGAASGRAPAKPWEKRQVAAAQAGGDMLAAAGVTPQMVGSSAASRLAPSSTGASSAVVAGSTGLTSAAAAQNMASTFGSVNGASQYGAGGTGAYGATGYGAASQYGTGATGAYGATGYGAGGLGSTYGSTYGTGGYGGGMGGYGGYGGMSSYGGGMGGYGGIGGYSSGYGGGYGGYGMSSRMGYGGMMGGPGGMMDPNGQLGWLSSFNQIVSSIGQITELLGMNAEALNFCIGSFVHFLERIGAMCAGMAAMLAPRPVFPPGHPRHGEPPVTEEEERSRVRRVRIFQFMVSMVALTCLYKGLWWLTRLRGKATRKMLVAPPPSGVGRDLENIFQRTVGPKRF